LLAWALEPVWLLSELAAAGPVVVAPVWQPLLELAVLAPVWRPLSEHGFRPDYFAVGWAELRCFEARWF
jgi:hypothetical protein